jgi:hypothetical protein
MALTTPSKRLSAALCLDTRGEASIPSLEKSDWPYDITLPILSGPRVVSDHTKLLRSHDWASTRLDAMDQWPEELRRNINMCMADPRPAALWWTKDRICIYNEPYSLILGKRHPVVFGRSFAEAWPELHANFSPHFDEVIQSGQAASGDDAFYMVERNGLLRRRLRKRRRRAMSRTSWHHARRVNLRIWQPPSSTCLLLKIISSTKR